MELFDAWIMYLDWTEQTKTPLHNKSVNTRHTAAHHSQHRLRFTWQLAQTNWDLTAVCHLLNWDQLMVMAPWYVSFELSPILRTVCFDAMHMEMFPKSNSPTTATLARCRHNWSINVKIQTATTNPNDYCQENHMECFFCMPNKYESKCNIPILNPMTNWSYHMEWPRCTFPNWEL